MALDFGQPGVDHAVEGLAVTDREAQDQDFALLVGVSSQAFIVTLHTQKKMGKSVRADLFIRMCCVGFSFPHFPFAQNALAFSCAIKKKLKKGQNQNKTNKGKKTEKKKKKTKPEERNTKQNTEEEPGS